MHKLDRECIRFNAVKRSLSKLLLNSMWGKLTDRNDRTINKIITEPKALYGYLATPGIEVVNLVFACDDVDWLSWKRGAEEDVPNFRHTNEVICAYVNSGGEDSSVLESVQAARECHLLRYRLGDIHSPA